MATQKASLIEKLTLLPHLAVGLSLGFLRLATRPFSTDSKPPTVYKDFIFTVARYLLSNVTIAHEKWLNPATEQAYLSFASQKGFQPDTAVLPSGLKVHWIGNKGAEKVFLYFHGGGYVNPLSPAHLDWLYELQADLSKTKSTAIAAVGYTCSPEGQYPLQLKQAAESLIWLLQKEGKKAEDIFVGGDSAGGHCSLALLSHIMHPHPDLPEELRVQLPGPLAGAILTSPWVKFPTDDDSVKRNEGSDFVCKPAADRWASAFMGSASYDSYNQPLLAPEDWFSGLDKVVKGIIVWGGGQEVLIDSIDAIAQKLKASFSQTEYIRTPAGAHVGWLPHKLIGIKGKEESTEAIESWMAARL
ncbi:hypothetical protein Q7P37_004475 [Cladosporium fusiforme]